jgi:hypothetical protein
VVPSVQVTPIPSNSGLLVLLALCALGSVAIYLVMRQRLPLKFQRFKGRERLSIKQVHDQFYPAYDLAGFAELWTEVSSAAEVPPELIRPTDKLYEELGPVRGFEVASEMDDLEEALMRRCQHCHLDYRTVKVDTVDDYIKLFARVRTNPKRTP